MSTVKVLVAVVFLFLSVYTVPGVKELEPTTVRIIMLVFNFLVIGTCFSYIRMNYKEALGIRKKQEQKVVEQSVTQEIESSLDNETEELERLIKQKERELENKKELKAKQDQLRKKESLEEKKRRLEQLQREIDEETDFLDSTIA